MFCVTAVDFAVFGNPLNCKFVTLVYSCVLKDHDMHLQDHAVCYALFPVIPQSEKLLGYQFHKALVI
jgi:hypothetical protein